MAVGLEWILHTTVRPNLCWELASANRHIILDVVLSPVLQSWLVDHVARVELSFEIPGAEEVWLVLEHTVVYPEAPGKIADLGVW